MGEKKSQTLYHRDESETTFDVQIMEEEDDKWYSDWIHKTEEAAHKYINKELKRIKVDTVRKSAKKAHEHFSVDLTNIKSVEALDVEIKKLREKHAALHQQEATTSKEYERPDFPRYRIIKVITHKECIYDDSQEAQEAGVEGVAVGSTDAGQEVASGDTEK